MAEPMTRRGVFAFVLAGILAAVVAGAQAHYIMPRGKPIADGKLTFGVALSGRPFAYRLDGAPPEGIATLPYLVVGDQMMVLKANPFRIRGPDDLAGRIVSTTAGKVANGAYDRLRAEHGLPDELSPFR